MSRLLGGSPISELLLRDGLKEGIMNKIATARHKTGIIVANLK